MARTDNDTWDLASSVGATATMVAAQRAVANREGLIDDPFAEPLVRAVGMEFMVKVLDGEIDLEAVDPEFNLRRAAKGMAVRTRHFDKLFSDAAATGVRQAVILAAGLDARAYRMDWPAGTTVFEVDQPEVIEFKSKTLADLGVTPTADRRTVAIDLRDDWPTALQHNGSTWGAYRMDSRGAADLSTPGGAGQAVRQHHRAQRARQPGGHRTHSGYGDVLRRACAATRRANEEVRFGHRDARADLPGRTQSRARVPRRIRLGRVVQTMREAYAANDFEFPDDDAITLFANLSYVSAVLV